MSKIRTEEIRVGDKVIVTVPKSPHEKRDEYDFHKEVLGVVLASRKVYPKKGFINRYPVETTEYAVRVGGEIFWRRELTRVNPR